MLDYNMLGFTYFYDEIENIKKFNAYIDILKENSNVILESDNLLDGQVIEYMKIIDELINDIVLPLQNNQIPLNRENLYKVKNCVQLVLELKDYLRDNFNF